jgi:hypothetical protein
MATWEDVQRSNFFAGQKRGEEVVVCPKCGSDHFSIETFQKFPTTPTSVGRKPMPKPLDNNVFHVLRCVCGEVVEPPATMLAGSPLAKAYIKFRELLSWIKNA